MLRIRNLHASLSLSLSLIYIRRRSWREELARGKISRSQIPAAKRKLLRRKFARPRAARELFRALVAASFAARIPVLEIVTATGINAACESRNQLLLCSRARYKRRLQAIVITSIRSTGAEVGKRAARNT